MHSNNNKTSHTGRDGVLGAIAGAVVGDKSHHGHTGRDAAIGGAGGAIAGHHGTNHGHGHNTHSKASTTHHPNGAVTHSTTTGIPHVPIGQKISGKMDVLVGEITKNPAKVAVGNAKQTGGMVNRPAY